MANAPAVKEKPQAPVAAPAEKERPQTVLSTDRLRGAEFERVVHVANPQKGHTLEDMLNPAYWAHVAPRMRPWNKIEVRAEDGSYYGELLVLACDRSWAKVFPLQWHDLTTADISLSESLNASSKFEISHTPNAGWSVIRKSDREVMKRDCQRREDAVLWLTEYLKTVPQA